MHISLPTVVVVGLAAGQAAATGWRLDANKYSAPSVTDNKCSDDQKSGYDWSSLQPGSFNSYGSNKFSGFTCGNKFGKRDGLTKRTFQDKCITADIDKEPKIECDGEDQMSIDTYQVSSSWDTDVEAHYGMPDGSTCKQTHRCTQGGNIVKNSQCGGAKTVTFKPKRGESGKNEKGESCNLGIHSIGFNCDKPTNTLPLFTPPTSTAVTSASQYTTEAETTSAPPSYETTSSDTETTSSEASPDTTSSVVPPSYETTTSEAETTTSEVSPETTSSVPSIPAYSSYANVSSTYPVESTVATSSYEGTTSTAVSPETSAPAYNTSQTTAASTGTAPAAYESSPSSEASPETSAPSYGSSLSHSPVTNTSAPVYSGTTSSGAEVPSQTYEAPETPDLLPKCLNTWVGSTDCKDNADYACYCKDNDLIKKVMDCIESWSDDDDKTQSAAGYLQGICAPYVPENPAIITACPSKNKHSETAPATETPKETAPASETTSTEGSPVTSSPPEMTTSTVYSTAVSTITSCAADVEDCPAASQTTAYVTETIAVSTTVCPVTEAETTKPAQPTTEASPEESGKPPVEYTTTSAPAEPSTITFYSTSAVTVTSCAPEVEDCPASSTVVSSKEVPVSYSVVETPKASSPASPEQPSEAAPTGEAPAPYTSAPASEVAPTGEAPAPYNSAATTAPPPTAPATTGPSTVITYSSSVEVPATYSTGESLGMEIPSSKTYITIDTTITVPQVQFITSTITAPGGKATTSVGLAAGSPPAAPAYPTATATANPVGGAASSTGFGTSYIPSPTASPYTPFTGAASVVRTGVTGFAFAAAAAFFAL